ncbi:MAG: Protoheme IX farnesyltransferase [Verrucomicrobiae bacterium]|nr:Protoheme IX farnesyltransferase [Verrucomicrobiae bacterium]
MGAAQHGAVKKLFSILTGWFLFGAAAFAQCAMCKEALVRSEEGRRLVAGLNNGILFLLAVPFVIVGLVGLKFFRAYRPGILEAYLEMTKPRIVVFELITTAIGCYLAGGFVSVPALVGVALAAGGAAVLNNYLEREEDAKMERTRQRALPAGKILPSRALAFGVGLILAGVVVLSSVNLLTSFLGLLAAFLYVLVYTPLKRVTWWNTTIGAIPGALPPLCGWAAATGSLAPGAWALFAIMVAWQHPHFYALAWLYREDYRRAGFRMLSVIDETGQRTFRQIVIFSVVLIGVSLWPVMLGMTGWVYFIGALLMGVVMLVSAVRLWLNPSRVSARQVFFESLIYLPLLCGLLVFRR